MDGRDTFCVLCGHDNSVIFVIDDERINCLCCRSNHHRDTLEYCDSKDNEREDKFRHG
jgi:hypothetical protein